MKWVKAHLLTGFLVLLLFFLRILWSWPDQNLRIITCDVGQGDAILIQRGFTQVLVDGGPNNRVLECLGKNIPFWDNTIEGILLTHPQADHLNGFVSVIQRYDVRRYYSTGIPNETAGYYQLIEGITQEKGAEIVKTDASVSVSYDDLSLKILWPPKENLKHSKSHYQNASYDLNTDSVVFRLEYHDFTALFTGDIGVKEELALISEGVLLDSDVLKVGHHGSKTSSSTGFVESVSPEVALISVGKKNRFGHPTPEVLEGLALLVPIIKRTDVSGTVVLVSDGSSYWFE